MELKSYATDGAPDIFIFTISTIRVSDDGLVILPILHSHSTIQALEVKYGVGSNKVKAATKLVDSTIKKVGGIIYGTNFGDVFAFFGDVIDFRYQRYWYHCTMGRF